MRLWWSGYPPGLWIQRCEFKPRSGRIFCIIPFPTLCMGQVWDRMVFLSYVDVYNFVTIVQFNGIVSCLLFFVHTICQQIYNNYSNYYFLLLDSLEGRPTFKEDLIKIATWICSCRYGNSHVSWFTPWFMTTQISMSCCSTKTRVYIFTRVFSRGSLFFLTHVFLWFSYIVDCLYQFWNIGFW